MLTVNETEDTNVTSTCMLVVCVDLEIIKCKTISSISNQLRDIDSYAYGDGILLHRDGVLEKLK
jgi:hypothetical protein